MNKKIIKIVIEALKYLNSTLKNPELENPSEETRIYGLKGSLDSLSLVTLIADIEGKIAEELGENITIADERAMSMKMSPFRTVKSISNYIEEKLIGETNNNE
jgi:acyl carrier protein